MHDQTTTEGPAIQRLPEGIVLAYERYELLEVAGKGGQSLVHHAIDRKTGVQVALKTSRLENPSHLERERDVLHRLAQKQIPNIPAVYDFTPEYLALTFLPGEPLHLHNSHMTLEDRARALLPVCDTLHAVHEAGYAHGDVKPANILLARAPSLVDFGSARAHPSEPHQKPIGTPRYFSPEQHLGITSPASDQYSFAITFYEFVTKRRLIYPPCWPEKTHEPFELDGIPNDLRTALEPALAHPPEKRYSTLVHLKEELARTLY